jgi:peptide/nickel transport system substrate-binding protein
LLAGSAPAATLRLAIPNPPIGRGNPYQAPGPANAFVAPAVFDALTTVDGDGTVRQALALSWSSDAEARVWTFRLRPGVSFSNGAAFDADAVVSALRYLTGTPLPADLVPLEFAEVAGFRVLDPLAVEITARRPLPLLPRIASVLFVVEPQAWARLGPQGFAAAPVGTGPFKVERWGSAGVTMSAARTSWRAPRLDGLEIVFQQDATARLQGLLAGRLDIALSLSAEDRLPIEDRGGRLLAVPVPAVTALFFLTAKPGSPFADVRVRRALNYAVDKERLVRSFFAGAVPVAGQPAAHNVLGYDPAIGAYPYDPARAKALLTDAGHGDGFAFTLEAVVGSSGTDGAIYQQIAQDLAAVGVHMTVRSVPGLRLGQNFRTGQWDGEAFAFFTTAEPTLDGVNALKYYTCDFTPRMFCDPDAAPLFAAAAAATTLDTRAAAARRLMARTHDQAPALFLYESPRFQGVSARVKDFRMDGARIAFEALDLAP